MTGWTELNISISGVELRFSTLTNLPCEVCAVDLGTAFRVQPGMVFPKLSQDQLLSNMPSVNFTESEGFSADFVVILASFKKELL